MGFVTAQIEFNGRAPDLDRIGGAINELTGLSVQAVARPRDPGVELFDTNGTLAFKSAPKDTLIVVTSYAPGAIRRMLVDESAIGPVARAVQGAQEHPGTQTVYLRVHMGQDLTMLDAAVHALHSLGGRNSGRKPSDVGSSETTFPLTEAQLLERLRITRRSNKHAAWTLLLLLPILVPLWVLSVLWFLITLPMRLWRDWRVVNGMNLT